MSELVSIVRHPAIVGEFLGLLGKYTHTLELVELIPEPVRRAFNEGTYAKEQHIYVHRIIIIYGKDV